MTPGKVNVYEACDKAIKAMNRMIVEDFGKLKTMNFDELNVIQTVKKVYREEARRAKKRYYAVGFEAYILGLLMYDIEPKKAHEMAEKAITRDWIEDILTQTDYVTMYRFDTETERKAYRLAEALEVPENRVREIDKAQRYWSQQLGQYAINVTDYAVVQAFTDAGVEYVEWITAEDERVCNECYRLDRQVFRIDEIPRKPHWGCRCRMRPVFRMAEEAAGGETEA